jgi:Domain of unknown function (DUF5655)/Domain of unknown function (DUF4287)
MGTLEKARETQLKNIEAKTGKSLGDLRKLIDKSGLTKHSEIRDMLRKTLGLGYGDANSLVHFAKQSDGQSAAEASGKSIGDLTAALYSGTKSELRPVHDSLLAKIRQWGDFAIAPKKGYFSLRRKKQFATIGPGTKGRLELGLNMRDVKATGRLEALKPGGMCQYRVFLVSAKEVDDELMGWVKTAFDSSA